MKYLQASSIGFSILRYNMGWKLIRKDRRPESKTPLLRPVLARSLSRLPVLGIHCFIIFQQQRKSLLAMFSSCLVVLLFQDDFNDMTSHLTDSNAITHPTSYHEHAPL